MKREARSFRPWILLLGSAALAGCTSTPADDTAPNETLGATHQHLTCVNLGGPVTDDAVLAQDPLDATKASANYGAAQLINVGTTGTTVRQALLRFDLSAIPPTATITSAALHLTKAQALGTGPITLHRATAGWGETTVSYSSFGGAFDPAVLASFNPTAVGSAVTLDVTSQVAAWTGGAQPNHGFLIAEPTNGRAAFGSSEAAASSRPQLSVCYAPSTCGNGVQDGAETGIDCGGTCAPCVNPCLNVTCVATDACHTAGVCNPSTGVCSNPAAPWGTACNDGDACTQTDACQNGTCVGGNPVVCSALDACHLAGSCDPASGACSAPAAADGTSCDDGDGCTVSDACQSGLCGGTSAAGSACSTGLPGVCGAGTMACTNGGLSCVQDQQAASESCGNALDDDCDGQADEGCGASCPAGFIPVAGGCQTTYFIGASDLDNLGSSCSGGVNHYNGCSSAAFGFHWTDLGAGLGPVSHVSVDFRQGISCAGSPQQASTSLNGVGTGSITANANQCTCTPGSYNDASLPSLPQGALSVYVAGGVNSFSIAPTTNCEGLSKNTLWGDAFAIVTVTYGSTGCDPNAAEVCNGYDDNCDGVADEGVTTTFYVDADGDGYGSAAATTEACSTPPGYAPTSTDCDDSASSTHPGAGESCDGVDQSCDGQVDEGNPGAGSECTTGAPGQCSLGLTVCTGGAIACAPKYPAVAEACNDGLDNDCNGLADEGCDGGICPPGFNAVNGTCQIVYLIDGSVLNNLGSNCSGGVNRYNGCSSAPYGFTWTDIDPQAGPLSGIDIEFNEGVSCLGSPTQTGAELNGIPIGSYSSHANQCTCTPVTDVATVSLLSGTANAAYQPGASNTFSIVSATNCAGLSENPTWAEAFARVRVTWGGAACDPSAGETICNGYDDDCNGLVDEGLTTTYYVDADSDGFGDASMPIQACAAPAGYSPNATDCDDTNTSIHPGAGETCDGVDQNCDGQVDEGNPGAGSQCTTGMPGICTLGLTACVGGAITCAPKYPATAEACLDGLDNDCNGVVDEGCDGGLCPAGFNAVNGACVAFYIIDQGQLDNLGSTCSGGVNLYNGCSSAPYGFHWDDVNPGVGPLSGVEIELTEGVSCLSSPAVTSATINGTIVGNYVAHANQCTCTPVHDSASLSISAQAANATYTSGGTNYFAVATQTNCAGLSRNPLLADAFARVKVTWGGTGCDPTYTELCNGFDDDCDGQIDEGVASTFYADIDVDGYGDPGAPVLACSIPPGHVLDASDCDDTNAAIHPGVAETCDGVDQNCDGQTDEGNPGGGALCTTASPGICAAGTTVCSGGTHVCVSNLSPTTDTCQDGIDQDCDGLADQGCGGGVCPNGMNLVGGKCVKVYLIELGHLDNLAANCDGTQVSYYNGCTSSPYGFHWTDVGGGMGPVTDVDVELREGLTCRTTPVTNPITLNGTAAGSFTEHANQCGCTPSSFTDTSVSNLPVAAYAKGGTNVLSIGTSTNCEGLSKNPAWGDGFARVYVTY